MSDVADAQPNDVFVDADGKIWRVIGIWREPTVIMRMVEPNVLYHPDDTATQLTERHGGVTGQMWDGFKRIYRRE